METRIAMTRLFRFLLLLLALIAAPAHAERVKDLGTFQGVRPNQLTGYGIVFGLNGIGKMARDAISTNDQPVIMGFTLVAATIVVVANLVIDLFYSVLDPRVRTGGSR